MAVRSRALACAFLGVLVVALIVAAPAAAEEPSILGNNLSVPVIFAEGYNIVGGDVSDPAIGSGFRSTPLEDNFAWYKDNYALYYMPGLLDAAGADLYSSWFYPQKTEATWQAEWADWSASGPVEVTRLDWGDSLLAKTWPVRAKIRLEVRLYRENTSGLLGYAMNHLEGAGIDEVWGAADAAPVANENGATGTAYTLPTPWTTVYSNCARLSLYALDDAGNPVGDELFDGDGMAVADKYGTDGPGLFGAEVNVGGYVIYGYTLDGKAMKLEPGDYRIVFSLDTGATWSDESVARNTKITGLDPIDAGASEWLYHSELAEDGFSSWVDFELVPKTTGGGGGGKPH
ncbi:MAG: hypothetical protein V2J16_12520 [Thermoleophilia bacterium]|jgi:hypothetical protein|nr:hypothetical protein [Thermoleophilia bacterium]